MTSMMARKSGRCSIKRADPIASFTGDGAYDRDDVYGAVIERHPGAAVIVPPRSSSVLSEVAETAPTQRDLHLQLIAERGRMGWQKASGYNRRALVEADISSAQAVPRPLSIGISGNISRFTPSKGVDRSHDIWRPPTARHGR